jgi:hypothetical protein
MGMMRCRTCRKDKPSTSYSHSPDCNACRASDPATAEARQSATRARRLRQYGFTVEEYEDLLASQQGVCAICGGPPGARSLHVDHDHQTGENRGLLCHNCNIGLGNFRDDPDLLLAAAAYLIQASDRAGRALSV